VVTEIRGGPDIRKSAEVTWGTNPPPPPSWWKRFFGLE
jgi:hypothetical protein